MTRNKYKEMMTQKEPYFQQLISDIEYDIMCITQLSTNNKVVVDQLERAVMSNGKYICYPKENVNDKRILPFDPFFNVNVIQTIFGLYVNQYMIEHGPEWECQNFYLSPNEMLTGLGSASCHFINGTIVTSNKYVNDNIRFIDLLFKLEGEDKSASLIEIDSYISFLREEKLLQKRGNR